MAKLSSTGRLVLFLVNSPYAHVSYSMGGGISPSVLVSMERGHGAKSNPRADTVLKLLDLGILEGVEFADLKLTARGRTILDEEVSRGWELVTEVGSKPRMERTKRGG